MEKVIGFGNKHPHFLSLWNNKIKGDCITERLPRTPPQSQDYNVQCSFRDFKVKQGVVLNSVKCTSIFSLLDGAIDFLPSFYTGYQ